MRRLLWIGDAGCQSGFARATHYTLEALRKTWDVAVLGLNYRGDPHTYPYPIYPAYVPGGDLFGVSRIRELMGKLRPDIIVFQNDPWNIPRYVEALEDIPAAARPALVGAIAVDGLNCRGRAMNGLDHVVFWTQFGADEAAAGGYEKSYSVIPLGVDRSIYKPALYDKAHLRKLLGLPEKTWGGFFFLNVNRNQPRKRLDLTLQAFAQFRRVWDISHQPGDPEPFLYLHVCPTGDQGYDLTHLAAYYKLHQQIILAEPGVYHGSSEAEIVATYQAADVQMSTTQGEGWGLTTLEGMACGIPQIAPKWAALGEWATAADLVPCSGTIATPGNINSIGGIVDQDQLHTALFYAYHSEQKRRHMIEAGLALAARPEFAWKNIGHRWATVLEEVLGGRQHDGRGGDAEAPREHQEEVPGGSRPSALPGD
jgi:D-inositol-3-phosphate glycosyltransferase